MMNSVPIDRWNIIYVIFYCMGTGSLLPWHFLYSGLNIFHRLLFKVIDETIYALHLFHS